MIAAAIDYICNALLSKQTCMRLCFFSADHNLNKKKLNNALLIYLSQ